MAEARAQDGEGAFAVEVAALIEADPAVAPIAELAGPLSERRIPEGFAGLAQVIISQQLSVAAANAIHERCLAQIEAFSPQVILDAGDEALRAGGLSAAKIRTLRAVAAEIDAGRLELSPLRDAPTEDTIAELTRIKGIGRWTAEVYALFGLRHPDIMPAGDLALRESARLAFAWAERPSEKDLLARADIWRPHRSVAARLLWAYYRAAKENPAFAPV
jgi:DNA-3-methyladenine glycosylase II